jgi:hypothetical protein
LAGPRHPAGFDPVQRATVVIERGIMRTRISFKSGAAQARAAASYFTGLANSLFGELVTRMEEGLYEVITDDGFAFRLRVWTSRPLTMADLHQLFIWLIRVCDDATGLDTPSTAHQLIPRLAAEWRQVRHEGATIYVERSVLPPGQEEEVPDLTVGVLGGRTVMVSTPDLMFIELQEGLCGFTVAGQGSYLLEEVTGAAVRRA